MRKVAAIFLVLVWFQQAQGFNPDLWQVPQFPGSTLLAKDKPLEVMHIKAQVTHLRTKASPKDILSFYEVEMAKQGWQFEQFLSDFLIGFIKEGRYLYVGIVPGADTQEVYIASSPESLSVCKYINQYMLKEQLAVDAPGKDAIDIPRYPNSKRRFDIIGFGGQAVLIYETTANSQEVLQFYRKAMPDLGWKELRDPFLMMLQQTNKILPGYGLANFDQENGQAMVAVFRVDDSFTQYSQDKPKGRSFIVITKNVEKEFDREDQGGQE